MNLVKKLFKHGGDDHGRGGTAPAKRESGGLLGHKHLFGFDRGFDKLWRDVERDPWSLVRDPWSAFERRGEQLNALSRWPAVDVSEDDHAVTVRCDVPGLDAKDPDVQAVEATYDKGTLTVTVPKVPGKGPRRVAVKSA